MPVYLVCVSGMSDSSEAECVSYPYVYLYGRGKQMSIFTTLGLRGWRRNNLYHCKQNRHLCVGNLHGQTAVRL